MPFYGFRCKCGNEYEVMTSYDKTGKYSKIKCPKCNSKKKEKLLSESFSFNFSNPVGTDRWNNSHDYRFHTKLPSAVQERENAKKKSHMGQTPYNNIDDISKGKYFGKVK